MGRPRLKNHELPKAGHLANHMGQVKIRMPLIRWEGVLGKALNQFGTSEQNGKSETLDR